MIFSFFRIDESVDELGHQSDDGLSVLLRKTLVWWRCCVEFELALMHHDSPVGKPQEP
jgi:hypothetical protein